VKGPTRLLDDVTDLVPGALWKCYTAPCLPTDLTRAEFRPAAHWYGVGMEHGSAPSECDARLGLPIPADARYRLVKRIVLKLTWFLTRHQMDHNLAMLRAVEEVAARVATVEQQVADHRHHMAQIVAGLEASLRAEILGSDRRSDQIETDLVRLSATVTALQANLESVAAELPETATALADSDVAEVRSLPGQLHR